MSASARSPGPSGAPTPGAASPTAPPPAPTGPAPGPSPATADPTAAPAGLETIGEIRDQPFPTPPTPAEHEARLAEHAVRITALAQQARAAGNDSAGARRAATAAKQTRDRGLAHPFGQPLVHPTAPFGKVLPLPY
jgi:hypothetical protein